MRKYFLLSAVALLATSTANATTDYAEVTAKATIEVANQLECVSTSIGWGIVVKQNNDDIVITNDTSASSDLISLTSGNPGDTNEGTTFCSMTENDTFSLPDSVPLKNGDKVITFTPKAEFDEMGWEGARIYGDLFIPANITAGDYIGTFTITKTY
ncbi:MAG: hypothetical protein E7016_07155 [Alphaproteobacteria bacterium]|nr:hypothetical protein [Alphaproteobacteria bacterium]